MIIQTDQFINHKIIGLLAACTNIAALVNKAYGSIVEAFLGQLSFRCEKCGCTSFCMNGTSGKPMVVRGVKMILKVARIICSNRSCRQTFSIFAGDMACRSPYLLEEAVEAVGIQPEESGEKERQRQECKISSEGRMELGMRHSSPPWERLCEGMPCDFKGIVSLAFLKETHVQFLQACHSVRVIVTSAICQGGGKTCMIWPSTDG